MTTSDYIRLIRTKAAVDYAATLREPCGSLKHPFLVPGSASYQDQLWDWDSWFAGVGLYQFAIDSGSAEVRDRVRRHARGCVLDFLEWGACDGWIPHLATSRGAERPDNIHAENMHKPCLAQQAAFLTRVEDGDAGWLREKFAHLQAFVGNYHQHHRHKPTGLYFWQTDACIGVDNDPCTFFRPPRSSGSIFLNALMYRELLAMVYLAGRLNLGEIAAAYQRDADALKVAIQEHCWDPWLGFFFSVDLNLVGERPPSRLWPAIHTGAPRRWDCLIQRIGVWSGFLPLWAGIADSEQARSVRGHYGDPRTFYSDYGVRTLSKLEKMYDVRASGNPSSWLGPIWGISNYMVFRGFVRCGLEDAAADLAEKTIRLFGRDYERFGCTHEYYQPENGEPILNPGFQSWNILVLNMCSWLERREAVEEF